MNDELRDLDTRRGIIAWFARNPVAANLLMLLILVGGLVTAFSIQKQMFPQIEINWLNIQVPYPGAASKEVEEGITIKIEEALEGVQGLDRVITNSYRGGFNAWIKVDLAYDPQEVLDEVKLQIDAISSFPDGMERPIIRREKYRQEVMYINLYGDLSYKQLKDLGNVIHDEIRALPLVNITEFYSGLNYEISIEVSKDRLREYGLTFRDIANAVRSSSANMSAGLIRAEDGVVSMRVENQAYRDFEFSNLPLLTLADGSQIFLGDVANIKDGFSEGLQYSKFNGKNSVTFFVGASDDQSITDVAEIVGKYVDKKAAQLPDGVYLKNWVDLTYYLEGRLNMMLENMLWGGLLVFMILALFLQFKLAFWVMVGLPLSFLGTLLMMPMEFIDVTINITSLFGFILVLGIVVDDAIVIGESAYTEIEEKGHSLDNVIRGAKRVALPATFGVLTTVAAFIPMLLTDGPESAFSQSIGWVVILCLLFSLVESKLILPAHLAHMRYSNKPSKNPLSALRKKIDGGMKHIIDNFYLPFLDKAIRFRYSTIASFLCFAFICIGFYSMGVIKFIGTPKIPDDFPDIRLQMNESSSESTTLNALQLIENTLNKVEQDVIDEYGQPMISDISVDMRNRTRGEITVKLVEPDLRPIDTFELAARWRDVMPEIPGVKQLLIEDSLFGSQRDDGDLRFNFKGRNYAELEKAAMALREKMATFEGVGDINDSRRENADEVRFDLKPLAFNLGLTHADIASQVAFGFYGLEAQRIVRDGEEIRVMVRYPEEQRNAIAQVDDVLITTSGGAEIPLSEVATPQVVKSEAHIRREDGARNVAVWAKVDSTVAEPQAIAKDIRKNIIPDILEQHPTVSMKAGGRVQEEMEANQEAMRNYLLSCLIIFALLAIPLRSYSQPLIIMAVIPFGVIGAGLGHFILGMDISAFSIFGIIAASGVVINDSLVMVDYINNKRREGHPLFMAVMESGKYRFRAIMLTSLTTFIGLIPIIMETSLQAQIVIPMAVSLAFGVLFATFITLLLVPCLYIALDDFHRMTKRVKLYLRGEEPEMDSKGEPALPDQSR